KHILFFVAGTLFSLVMVEVILFHILLSKTYAQAISNDPFPQFHSATYPQLEHSYIPILSAQTAFVMDANSRVVLYSKNENLRFSPASTTKIVTALTALDYFKLNDVLVAKNPAVEPVVLGLYKGEKMTFENLLYAMFLPSANDAALTISQNYPGGEKAFVAKMNDKIKSLHLVNTHFSDPIGLNDDGDYTTAKELALIASFAIDHPEIARIVHTKYYTVTSVNGDRYPVENLNKLLGQYGVTGLKTGYTEEAGQVLVTSSEMQGHTFITVVMNSEDRFADTEKLLQLIQNNVSYLPIHP
ncbi:MAG TPA: D-alanyl-D-alanine carboxypeptidase family protein, partial [Patescibacteria group bacterium]|nr:D-alanyl-D-alanine carboxypeptidase family protein [Patescibacteria group bacterium]